MAGAGDTPDGAAGSAGGAVDLDAGAAGLGAAAAAGIAGTPLDPPGASGATGAPPGPAGAASSTGTGAGLDTGAVAPAAGTAGLEAVAGAARVEADAAAPAANAGAAGLDPGAAGVEVGAAELDVPRLLWERGSGRVAGATGARGHSGWRHNEQPRRMRRKAFSGQPWMCFPEYVLFGDAGHGADGR